MPRGGSRKHPEGCKCGNCPKLGRKKLKPEVTVTGDKNFASRVLDRIGKAGWLKYVDVKEVQSDEDFALHLVASEKWYAEQFNKLLDRKFGKPVQTVNHVHDKPIDLNVNVSIAEIVRKVRQRKQEYERSRS